jgi:succinate dehydrogenase / fumarate reductase membrane anchor subunit
MSLRTPLGKVRGLGSAKHGLEHWWAQRLTAVALLPLSIWFIVSLLKLAALDHAELTYWLASPLNAALLIFLVFALFHHAQLGMQVVIEDYIHSDFEKIASLLLVKFLAIFCVLISVLSIIKIFLGI